MAQSALTPYSEQRGIVESEGNVSVDLSNVQEDSNISMFEYVDQSAMTLSGKEIFLYILLIFLLLNFLL